MNTAQKAEAFKAGLAKVADELESEGNLGAAGLIRDTLPEFNTILDRDLARLYDAVRGERSLDEVIADKSWSF